MPQLSCYGEVHCNEIILGNTVCLSWAKIWLLKTSPTFVRFTAIEMETPFQYVVSCLQCSVTCGSGVRTRLIECPQLDGCDPTERPRERTTCHAGECEVAEWVTGPWSKVRELLSLLRLVSNCVVLNYIFFFTISDFNELIYLLRTYYIVITCHQFDVILSFRTSIFGTKMCSRGLILFLKSISRRSP